jgi:hypothetical protein
MGWVGYVWVVLEPVGGYGRGVRMPLVPDIERMCGEVALRSGPCRPSATHHA